jgi:hypothetical protein
LQRLCFRNLFFEAQNFWKNFAFGFFANGAPQQGIVELAELYEGIDLTPP